MTVEFIAKALGGRAVGRGWSARCPAHDDSNPSLSIVEDSGVVLVHCHAGCDQRQVIAALRERGLWGSEPQSTARSAICNTAVASEQSSMLAQRSATAISIWRRSVPAIGTPVVDYLSARGITLAPPFAVRFHSGLKHHSGGTWPCMVALVTRGADDTPLAIHRTFLTREGRGKAPVKPAKMMLGPCRGGAVRLSEPGEVLMIGEGIETCLAAMQATGHPAWAALSTSGLRALDLPDRVGDVIVLADGDDPGEAAARDCALRWMRQGRRVRIARPPRGLDFNDMLLGRACRNEESSR